MFPFYNMAKRKTKEAVLSFSLSVCFLVFLYFPNFSQKVISICATSARVALP